MTHSRKFYLLIIIQIVFLLGMVGTKIFTLKTGKKILLEVVPVDPRDIFRWEYAMLNYKISTIDFPEMQEIKINQIVYVKLKQFGKYWEAVSVSKEKPILNKDEIFIIGKKREYNRIEYGIESYFVTEGKAIDIERIRAPAKVSVEVSVDRFGNSAINRIFIDDKPIEF